MKISEIKIRNYILTQIYSLNHVLHMLHASTSIGWCTRVRGWMTRAFFRCDEAASSSGARRQVRWRWSSIPYGFLEWHRKCDLEGYKDITINIHLQKRCVNKSEKNMYIDCLTVKQCVKSYVDFCFNNIFAIINYCNKIIIVIKNYKKYFFKFYFIFYLLLFVIPKYMYYKHLWSL